MDETCDPLPTFASDLPADGFLIADRYHVRRRLGRGSSKEVYLAYDERLDREVAVALVIGAPQGSTARARLEREARVTGRLGDHPNVITVYDTCEVDGVPCLVMRAMAGGSLAEALDRGRLGLADAVRIGRDIAVALAHAHAHGVVHRDVKPANVWLDEHGGGALGDFGIAHVEGADRLTSEGALLGTVRYMSPEQIRGAEVGPASDLYSLGVTLYELVTGRPPFTATEPQHVLTQHLTEPPPPLDAPPDLRAADPRPAREGAARPSTLGGRRRRAAGRAPAGRGVPARRAMAVLVVRGARGSAVIERHGGTVQRRPDALVGLFELIDAPRAVRAALALRAERPDVRCAIEAGEVFVDAGTATGAPVDRSGRLAEGAPPGEIVLGDALRASLPTARVDAATGRLLELDEEPLLRVPETPFVGRADDLEALELAFAQAAAERVCRMVTVTGVAGIGKSRLAAEFATRLGPRATILAGRCTPPGEGTTYQPLVDDARATTRARGSTSSWATTSRRYAPCWARSGS